MGDGKLESFEKQHEEDARNGLKKRLETFAHEELEDHPEDLKNIAGIEVVHGHAVSEILLAADRLNADVIVMGTHGKGTKGHTFLGSVAEKVLHKSRKPVFVIPIPD
jgi:nucleotide-binding universal stress UspA family protein